MAIDFKLVLLGVVILAPIVAQAQKTDNKEDKPWRVLGNEGFSRGSRRNLIWEDGFEAGGWRAGLNSGSKEGWAEGAPLWNQSMNQGAHSARAVEKVGHQKPRAGKFAMRFEWQRAGYDGSNVSKKAHLFAGREPSCREERWWGWSLFLPAEGAGRDKEPEILAQWHSTPDKGEAWTNPPLSLSQSKGDLSVSWLYDTRQITPKGWKKWDRKSVRLGKAPLDRWIDWVWHIKWDPWGNGLLQVWMDGKLVVDEKKIAIGFNDRTGNYPGFGIYKYSGKSEHERRVVFVDEIRGGNAQATFKDVAPGEK